MKRIIVDQNDTAIGAKESGDINFTKEIYRISVLWLGNSVGEVLIAQRRSGKANDAGLWGPSVAGTVEEGESYEANIYKEAAEEIGVTGITFEVSRKIYVNQPRKFFAQFYTAISDMRLEDFILQADEVESVRWIKSTQLRSEFSSHPERFIPNMSQCLEII